MLNQDQNLVKQLVSRESIYQGKGVELWLDELLMPNGNKLKKEHLHHPHSVAVLAIDDDNRCALVRQYRYAIEKVILEVPAGKIDKGGESPLEAAVRELKEETGYTADEWISLGIMYPTPGVVDEVLHLYLARGLHRGEQELEEYEFIQVEWVPLCELERHIAEMKINDGKTICTLARAKMMDYVK